MTDTNPLGTLLQAIAAKAAEAKPADAQEPQLAKPTEQQIDDDFIVWTWDTGNPEINIRASVERATGEYYITLNEQRMDVHAMKTLTTTLLSAVEWRNLWRLFLAEYIVPAQVNSQPQEFVVPEIID